MTWTSSVGNRCRDAVRRAEAGFSLLELIVVLFLIGLVAGLTTPVLISSLERLRGAAEVRKIASTLRYARGQAIAEKSPYAFHGDIDNNKYQLVNLVTKSVASDTELLPNVKFSGFAFGADAIDKGDFNIIFFPQGNTSGGLITLDSTSGNQRHIKYTISLDTVTGKTRTDEAEE